MGGGGKDAQAGGEDGAGWGIDRRASVTPCESSLGRRDSSVVTLLLVKTQ